jgi:hypothetical protein
MQLHLTTDHDNAVKWFSKPTLKNAKECDGLYLIEMYKTEVVYDKPIYVGTSILDLSKLCMMQFHYDVMQDNFGSDSNVIYSDTDSLVYNVKHDDVYEWIKNNKQHFDLSDAVRDDMKDNTNKKVLGKFKDELNSCIMTEFLALNPKVYSYNYLDENETIKNSKKAKGVSKAVVKKNITFKDYETTLNSNESCVRDVVGIRSFNHQLFTVKNQKIALSSWYDKMVMVNEIDCEPFGYNKI